METLKLSMAYVPLLLVAVFFFNFRLRVMTCPFKNWIILKQGRFLPNLDENWLSGTSKEIEHTKGLRNLHTDVHTIYIQNGDKLDHKHFTLNTSFTFILQFCGYLSQIRATNIGALHNKAKESLLFWRFWWIVNEEVASVPAQHPCVQMVNPLLCVTMSSFWWRRFKFRFHLSFYL